MGLSQPAKIAKIHTPCINCVFAEYNDFNSQIGCDLGYIEMFRQQGVEVVEAYTLDENNEEHPEKEFYIINDKTCIGFRNTTWLKNNDLLESSREDRVNTYNEWNKLHYLAIINTQKLNLEQLIDICESIKKAEAKPQKVCIVRYPDNLEFSLDKLQPTLDNLGIPWKLQSSIDADTTEQFFIDNNVSMETEYRFVLSVNAPTQDIARVINEANDIVHNKLDRFMLLRNEDNSCYVFPAAVYRYHRFMGDNILTDERYCKII